MSTILEDSRGDLWVGTRESGVYLLESGSRRLRNFRNDPDDPVTLIEGEVNDVYEDPLGRIWISTRHGLSSFSAREQTFRGYRPELARPEERGDYLLEMTAADGGGLWIGSAIGLYHFDPLTGVFTAYVHDPEDPDSPVKGPVLSVLRDRTGIVWGGVLACGPEQARSGPGDLSRGETP